MSAAIAGHANALPARNAARNETLRLVMNASHRNCAPLRGDRVWRYPTLSEWPCPQGRNGATEPRAFRRPAASLLAADYCGVTILVSLIEDPLRSADRKGGSCVGGRPPFRITSAAPRYIAQFAWLPISLAQLAFGSGLLRSAIGSFV